LPRFSAAEIVRVIQIARIVRPGGHLVICEETDVNYRAGDMGDPARTCAIGRSVGQYQKSYSFLAYRRFLSHPS
jgi:hypothetical protein